MVITNKISLTEMTFYTIKDGAEILTQSLNFVDPNTGNPIGHQGQLYVGQGMCDDCEFRYMQTVCLERARMAGIKDMQGNYKLDKSLCFESI